MKTILRELPAIVCLGLLGYGFGLVIGFWLKGY